MKKPLALLLCFLTSCTTAFAYTFPEPDWGAVSEGLKCTVTWNENTKTVEIAQ